MAPYEMSTDQQEAESHKYSQNIIMVLPLKSGAYAVFNHKREFQFLIDAECQIIQLCQYFPLPKPTPTPTLADLLKDLDL